MKYRHLFIVLFSLCLFFSNAASAQNPFLGMWSFDVEGGGVGWLEVHEKEGYLDADLLWIGGSVVPVGNVYLESKNSLVVTRTISIPKTEDKENGRKHSIAHIFRMSLKDGVLSGTADFPFWDGTGVDRKKFSGKKLELPVKPDLAFAAYGKQIRLFNNQNLDGWRLVNPEDKNGFSAVDGVLVNNPVQKEGEHVHYGNLRTEAVFTDFNLRLEVNVPEGNNSGIYLRGMYEIQVLDSYGQELDSHHMGAVYSRIAPTVAAEKPAGEWQALDITLYKRHVTVKLNDKVIIDNQPIFGPTGGAIISDVDAPGPIFLQGDHGKVSYRNIRIAPIIQ